MLRLSRALSLTLFAFFFLILPTHAQDTFKLITPTTGWYLTRSRLFYTTDSGATWIDISPLEDRSTTPLPTVAVYFHDIRTAWALILVGSGHVPDCGHSYDFDLVSTTDAGAQWHRRKISIPLKTVCPRGLSFRGAIFFLDSAHGWINFVMNSDTNSPMSLLLSTTDGGSTWQQSDDNPCGPGPLFFNSPQDGWILSQDMHRLCATHNGGKTFNPEKFPLAHQYGGDIESFSLPTFLSDQLAGFVPVTYATPTYDLHHFRGNLVVFETRDAGLTWEKSMEFRNFYMDDHIGISIAGDRLFMPTVGEGKYCTRVLQMMTHGGGAFQFTTKLLDTTLSFADYRSGWVYIEGVGLISTHDGGQTWTNTATPQTRLRILTPHTNLVE
jgi:hypothetical protein